MMNFLSSRSAPPVVPDQPPEQEVATDITSVSKSSGNTSEGLIAEDPFTKSSKTEGGDVKKDPSEALSNDPNTPMAKNSVPIKHHSDVTEDEGWITIPYRKLPEDWSEAADLLSLHALDRSFIFPGEQLHILVCLSTSKQDTEVITPVKVAAVMSKNGIVDQNDMQQNKTHDTIPNSRLEVADSDTKENGGTELMMEKTDRQHDILDSESTLRSESHRERTQTLLARFRNSHFFVRIVDADDDPQSNRNLAESSSSLSEVGREKSRTSNFKSRRFLPRDSHFNTVIDKGSFDASAAGGMARNIISCCALPNGDIVVLLQVNVGNNFVKDPVLEVLQFEKYQNSRNLPSSENHDNADNQVADPCGDLLKWLLPLDRSVPPPARLSSPLPLSSTAGVVGSASQRSTSSTSTGSQLFSFGHFKSYSVSSLTNQSQPATSTSYAKPSFDLEDWDKFSSQKLLKNQEVANEGLLSFRGVSLEPERFSVYCGLEGIYVPGRRWRRKLEILQPVEIHSFVADCDTEDLLCVQIKNVSPAHIPDVVIFLDAITIVFEEAPKGGPPQSLPIACIEAGNDHSLPNLALRRGEEHSFILKPANLMRDPKTYGKSNSSQLPYSQSGRAASSVHPTPKVGEGNQVPKSTDQYAVLVSCRCNYTESRLFFKQPTSWHPRLSRDLMISVATKMSEQALGPNGGFSPLPVQVLTLQASNLTSEDLTLTVLAPASLNPPPSVVSLNSTPSTLVSPFTGFPEIVEPTSGMQRLTSLPVVAENKKENAVGGRSVSLNEQTISTPDVTPSNGLGCTHLWLQSTVPLGCVPSHSTATVKLELLPLTDGIINLNTLQIAVKEKGVTYIPEQSLKIHATSSIATDECDTLCYESPDGQIFIPWLERLKPQMYTMYKKSLNVLTMSMCIH
ncbi:uncharacterized protein [Aristolochia californica]|uniref:uncharacterized protein n=1 Tax=Aristolochia californica TaxID=171875 RepID=UPI0035DED20B